VKMWGKNQAADNRGENFEPALQNPAYSWSIYSVFGRNC